MSQPSPRPSATTTGTDGASAGKSASAGAPTRRKLHSDPLVFFASAGFITLFVALTLVFGDKARATYSVVSGWLLSNLGWMYIGGCSLIFVFLVVVFVSKFGNLRLGDDDEEPEYSLPVWFAMLFAAGLGATLMFWGAAEPLHHAFNPPRGDFEPMSQGAIEQAFEFTYYHFAIHMWILFVLPGLAMGYFIYKRKMPARLSSVFSPILGGAVYRWPGKLIDALSIIGTVFGLAVSVGLGVLQINAGMNIMWGVPLVGTAELIIIVVITAIACVSVASGLDKGIKFLSNLNIAAAFLLMLFVLAMGPTLTLLGHTTEAFGVYASSLPELMFWTDSYQQNPGWQNSWTTFYWAWTICWGPFVGMFIARISRGRTVRQFIGGVLGLTTVFTVIWFSIFGRAAIEMELDNPGVLTGPVVEDGETPVALFALLEQYPFYAISGAAAVAIIVIFFITSIDSAALVMDTFATGEEAKSPTYYRVGWAISVGLVTAALLFINDSGISAIQEVVIIVALPFFLMMFVMMYSLLKGMNADFAAERRLQTRQWEKTDTPEKLEVAESQPAPGYDEEGNPIDYPELEYDEYGNVLIPGNTVVGGNLGVAGDFDPNHDPNHAPDDHAPDDHAPGDRESADRESAGRESARG